MSCGTPTRPRGVSPGVAEFGFLPRGEVEQPEAAPETVVVAKLVHHECQPPAIGADVGIGGPPRREPAHLRHPRPPTGAVQFHLPQVGGRELAVAGTFQAHVFLVRENAFALVVHVRPVDVDPHLPRRHFHAADQRVLRRFCFSRVAGEQHLGVVVAEILRLGTRPAARAHDRPVIDQPRARAGDFDFRDVHFGTVLQPRVLRGGDRVRQSRGRPRQGDAFKDSHAQRLGRPRELAVEPPQNCRRKGW